MSHLRYSLEGYDWQTFLKQTIAAVQNHPAIEIHLNSEIEEVEGFIGNFITRL